MTMMQSGSHVPMTLIFSFCCGEKRNAFVSLQARTIVGATPWDTQGPQDTDAMDLMWTHW